MTTLLRDIFNKNLSDKGSDVKNSHHYHIEYEKEFLYRRKEPLFILEVGVFKGISVKCWLEYFENVTIYGIDIFERISPEKIEVLQHERVRWLKCDSTNEVVKDMMTEKWGNVKFDYIIDDGLHTPEANRKTFENLIGFLKPKGVYYIEDVWALDDMTKKQRQHPWLIKNKEDFTEEKHAEFVKTISKHSYERIDFRNVSRVDDSYMFKIKSKDDSC